MNIALTIFLIAGPIGVIDVLYFHIYRFRLWERPASTAEHLTHLARGFLFPFVLWLLIAGEPHGVWALVLIGLFAIDFVVSAIDLWVEPASRAPDVVPQLELMIHYLGATAMTVGGAFAIAEASQWISLPTELVPRAVPAFQYWAAWAGIIGAVALTIVEGALFYSRVSGSGRSPAPASPEMR